MADNDGLRRYDAKALLSKPVLEVVIAEKAYVVTAMKVAQALELAAAAEAEQDGKKKERGTGDDEFLYLAFHDQGLTRADLKRATTLEKNVTTKIVMAVFFQAQAPEELRDIPGMDRVEMFVSTGLGRLADSFARTLASGSGTSSS